MAFHLDVMPNAPKDERTREDFGNILRQKFEQRLPEAVERIWELPPVILHDGEYVSLLFEARDLFVDGYFYSCVAMCGIVGERLIKDLLRASVLIHKAGIATRPSDEASNQLERVDISSISRFLNKAQLLDDAAHKAARDLGELRNDYAHARGKDPHKDAKKAIDLLHTLVEGTVSVFKDFEPTDKGFAPKA